MDFTLVKINDKLRFSLPFIFKYVDDLVRVVSIDKIDVTLKTSKSTKTCLKFTVKSEKDSIVLLLRHIGQSISQQ